MIRGPKLICIGVAAALFVNAAAAEAASPEALVVLPRASRDLPLDELA